MYVVRDRSKSKREGRGGGGVGAFENVVVTRHMTHPFHLKQNLETHPDTKVKKLHDPPHIKHDIFGCIIEENHILCMK